MKMNGAIQLAGAITIAGARAMGLRALGTVLIAGAWLAMAPPAHGQGTLPQISIEAGADIDEGDNAIFTLSRTGGTTAELGVNISVREEFARRSTANKPDRVQGPLPESVTFAVGSAQATLSLPTIDDALHHVGIRIIAEIESDTGYALGTASEASLIAREDDPLTMQFYIRGPDEIEEGGSLQFAVNVVTNGFTGEAVFLKDLENGTAQAGSDYGTFSFPELTKFSAKRTSGDLDSEAIVYREDGTILFGGNIAGTLFTIYDDGELENDETMTIRIGIVSSDPHVIAHGTTKTVTIRDRKPSITIGPSAGLTSEGMDASFTLTRDGDTSNPLHVDVVLGETGDMLSGTAPRNVTFGAGSASATVAVATEDDGSAEPDSKVTLKIEADADRPAAYRAGSPAAASVTVTDDDGSERAVKISPLTLDVREDSTITYAVALGTEPTGTVTVTPTSGDGGAASVAPTSLEFTETSWATPQSITITARADSDSLDETVMISHAVTGADYADNAVPAPEVTVRISDAGDSSGSVGNRGVRIVPTTVEVEEGDTSKYSVVLTARPTGNVRVTLDKIGNVHGAFANPKSLRFTPSNWNIAQRVIVTTYEDVNTRDETLMFEHTVVGADYGFENVGAPAVTVRVHDDDRASTVATVRGGLGGSAREGEDVVFRLGRTGATAERLEVAVSVSEDAQFVDTSNEGRRTVTFEPGAGTATLTIPTVNNAFGEPDGTIAIEIEPSENYEREYPTVVRATVEDDERRAQSVILTLSANAFAENSTASTVTVTATLDGDPRREATTVSIDVGAPGDAATEGTDYQTVGALNVTIPSGASNANTNFSLAPVNDSSAEGSERISVSGQSPGLTVRGAEITIEDDETASAVTLEASPAWVSEAGGARTVTITARVKGMLRTVPTVVTVQVGDSGDSATEGTDYATVASLNVTVPANAAWGSANFTLTPTNDTSREGRETISVTGSVSGLTVSATQIAIADDEEAASGAPTITTLNAFRVPATLSVDLSGITDPNGVTGIAASARYRWQRYGKSSFRPGGDVGTGATYTLTHAESQGRIGVEVTFEDDAGNVETRSSARFPVATLIQAASVCLAPVHVAGTDQVWTGKVTIEKSSGSTPSHGFTASSLGALDDTTVGIGTNSYVVDAVSVGQAGELVLGFTGALTAAEKRTLTMHVCDEAFDLSAAQESNTTRDFTWSSTGLDWSAETERTVYLSRDATAPTATSAVVDGISVVIGFSERVVADTLANTAFEVNRTPAMGAQETIALEGTPWINGQSVTLTLSAAVTATDSLVQVSYMKPGSDTGNALADRFGNLVADFTRTMIRNTTNTPPTAADSTVTATEDTTFAFAASSFSFTDANTGMELASVTIETLPASGRGTLELDGSRVHASAVVTRAQLDAGSLTYVPPQDANGSAHASFTFRVSDGRDESARAYTMTIDITSINDAATGAPTVVAPNVFRVPAKLGVNLDGIDDVDGVAHIADNVTAYQWKRFDATGTTFETNIGTGAVYTLTSADVGKRIGVEITFVDDEGATERASSAPHPTSGTITAKAAACPAPTLTGGAVLLEGARRVDIGAGRSSLFGFGPELGSIDDATFSAGANSYSIGVLTIGGGKVNLFLDRELAAEDRRTLALHFCDTELRLREAGASGSQYLWTGTGLDWSVHAQRIVYVSRDVVTPTLVQAVLRAGAIIMTFSEDLGAAASLANGAFTVTKNDGSVNEVDLTLTDSPVIDGRKVTLMLDMPTMSSGTDLTVSYEKPETVSGNALVDRFGNEVADIEDHAVILASNEPATGVPTITVPNVFRVPAKMTADISGIGDLNGVTRIAQSATYQWKRFDATGTTFEANVGTGSAYTLTSADAGKRIGVEVMFVDDGGFPERASSATYPTTGTITAQAACPAPTLTGGAELLEGARQVDIGTATGLGASFFGYGPGLGSIDDATFSAGANSYSIGEISFGRGSVNLKLDRALAAEDQRTLALHFCDTELPLREASYLGSQVYGWSGTGVDWSGHAQRTVYVSRDVVTPTLVQAVLRADAIIMTFSEDLGAAASLANSAFTVTKTDGSANEVDLTLTDSPVIDGRKVTLMLDMPTMSSGTDLTVSYEKPETGSGNALVDRFGNEVADIEDHAVTLASNEPATGMPTITVPNVFRVPAKMTADISGIGDLNGVTRIAQSATYQWKRFDATGTTFETNVGTGSVYTLTNADAAKRIGVEVTFVDDNGFTERAPSATYPTSGTITAQAACPAPTLTGGAVLLEGARRVDIATVFVAGSRFFGFTMGFGSIDDATFSAGANSYSIDLMAIISRTFTLRLDRALATDDRRTLALHICDTELRLREASRPGSGQHGWVGTGVDWSVHAQRTVYVSRDVVAPTFESASVAHDTLVLVFSEPLGAAASLSSTAFTVKKTPANGTEEDVVLSGAPTVQGTEVTLALAQPLAGTDQDVKVSYEKPDPISANALVDRFENAVDDFDDAEATNTTESPPRVASITRHSPAASPTNANSLVWRVTFSEAVTNADAADFEVSGTTATLTVADVTGAHAVDVTATGGDLADLDATVTLSFATGQDITDSEGNALAETAPTGAQETEYVLDNTAPAVESITRHTPGASPTNADTLVWRVTFSEALENADAADFEVTGTTATLTVADVTGAHAVDVTATGGDLADLNATVTLSFASAQDIADAAGNALADTAPTGAQETEYVVDNIAPGVESITRHTPAESPTNADSLVWRVTFSEAVTNADAADFEVSGTTATLTIADVTGAHAVDVSVSGGDLMDLEATVTLSFASAQDIADATGNALAETAPTGAQETEYVLDNTAPGVESITRHTPAESTTNANSLVWRVTFSEAVTNADAADFEVTGTTATHTVADVAGAHAVDVTASDGDLMDLEATVTLSFASAQDIADAAGNALADTAPTGAQETEYVLDNTAPAVESITRHTPGASPTNADTLVWRVRFSEAVTNADATDFEVTGTTATLTVADVTGAHAVDVTATGGDLADLEATVTLSFASGQDIADAAGNALADTAPTGAEETEYVVDNTAPSPIDPIAARVGGTSLVVTFDEALDAASVPANTRFTVMKTPSGSSQAESVALSGTPAIDGAALTLTLAAAVAADDTVTVGYDMSGSGDRLRDPAGNEVADFDEDATNDTDAPPRVVSVVRHSPADSPTNANSLVWRVTFSEAVTNADAADFEVSGTTATLTLADVIGAHAVDVTATGGDLADLDATVTLSFAAGQDITDSEGNALAETALTGAQETEYVLDNTAPAVESITRHTPDASPANADTLVWRVTFSEALENADATDFEVTGTTATLTLADVTGAHAVDVTATGGDLADLNATVTLSFGSAQDIADAAGNALAETAPTGAQETEYVVDNTAPSPVDPIAARVGGTSLVVTFDEALDAASVPANTRFTVMKTPSGSSQAESVALSGTPAIDGAALTLTLAAAVAADDTVTVGYDMSGSGDRLRDPAGNEVADFDEDASNDTESPPGVVSIVRHSPAALATNADSLVWRVTFSEAVTNADAADFEVTGTTATHTVADVAGAHAVDVTVSGGDLDSLDATVTLSFASGQDIVDAGDNALTNVLPTGANEDSYTIDNSAPSLPTTGGAAINGTALVLTFGEALDAVSVPETDTFKVTVDGGAETEPSAVAIDGAVVTLTLATAVTAAQAVTVRYTAPVDQGAVGLRDAAGNAVASDTAARTVANETGATVPGTPASLVANVGDGGVTLAWEAPASDGGTAVTGYEYRYRKESETTWPAWTAVAADPRQAAVSGLDNGTLYRFELRAVNQQGAGEAADTTATPDATTCNAPQLAGRDEVWRGTLTVGRQEGGSSNKLVGYGWYHTTGALSGRSDSIEIGTNRYRIGEMVLLYAHSGDLVGLMSPSPGALVFHLVGESDREAELTDAEKAALVLHVCAREFAFASATRVGGGTTVPGPGQDRHYVWNGAALQWSHGLIRTLVLTEPASGDARSAVSVESVTEPTGPGEDAVYAKDDRIEVRVRFSAPVEVDASGGAPTLGIALGGVRRDAAWLPATGAGAQLIFALTVADAGAEAAKAISNGIRLNGGTIRDTAGTDAVLDYGEAPGVVSVEVAPAPGDDGTWSEGEAVEVTLAFAEPVDVGTAEGTPSLGLQLPGAGAHRAVHAGGSGTDRLVFAYTPVAADGSVTAVLVDADSLALNGGTIVSTGGLDAVLSHNGAGSTVGPRSPGPALSVADTEGAEGATLAFQVTLSQPTPTTVTVAYATRDGAGEDEAVAGEDYTAASGTLSFKPGETQKSVAVTVTDDGLREGAETLTLHLSGAQGAGIADGEATGTIGASASAAALTARFVAVPPEHDGKSTFTVELHFSEAPAQMSNRTVRDTLFNVSGGEVRKARRLNPPSNLGFEITVEPTGNEAATLELATDLPACEVSGSVCTADGRMLEGPLSVTVPGPAALSVADAEVDEEPGAKLDFVVSLDRRRHAPVSVDYATADGTAVADEDYTATSGTLVFAAGETQKTVSVRVLDDGHDEGSETLTFTLSNASGARIADGEATGTINNSDAIPKAWIARFGRTVAEQVLEAVEGRMRATPAPGVEVAVAGQRLETASPEEIEALEGRETQARLQARGDWLAGGTGEAEGDARANLSRGLTGREMLTGSSFALTAGTAGEDMVSLWGRGAVTHFDGHEGDLTLDGEVVTGMLGADWTWGPVSGPGRWTAGLIVSHSDAEGGYSDGSESGARSPAGSGGRVEATLTGVFPWARHALSERLEAWGAAGYGHGELTVTPRRPGTDEDGTPLRTDLELGMAAAGLRGDLLDPEAGSGFRLTGKTDAMVVQTASGRGRSADGGNLAAARATVTRLRLGVEGARPIELGGGATLTPSLEIGLRHDGGDAETGFGLDFGGGLALSVPGRGLKAELRGRGLVSHESQGFRDRGFSGALSWRQKPESDRGAKLTLTQTVGGSSAGGADALLSRTTLDGLAANDNGGGDDLKSRRLELNLGYGLSAFGDRFTLTREAGVGLSDAGRDYSLGWRLVRGGSGGYGGSLELSFEATRRESANDDADPEHAAGFRLTARW